MRIAPLAARVIDWLAIATFCGMFACVLGQVGFRYFLGDPLTWSDELARYLFVWCSFLGWIVAARRRSHLAIGSLPERASCGASAKRANSMRRSIGVEINWLRSDLGNL